MNVIKCPYCNKTFMDCKNKKCPFCHRELGIDLFKILGISDFMGGIFNKGSK